MELEVVIPKWMFTAPVTRFRNKRSQVKTFFVRITSPFAVWVSVFQYRGTTRPTCDGGACVGLATGQPKQRVPLHCLQLLSALGAYHLALDAVH